MSPFPCFLFLLCLSFIHSFSLSHPFFFSLSYFLFSPPPIHSLPPFLIYSSDSLCAFLFFYLSLIHLFIHFLSLPLSVYHATPQVSLSSLLKLIGFYSELALLLLSPFHYMSVIFSKTNFLWKVTQNKENISQFHVRHNNRLSQLLASYIFLCDLQWLGAL